MGRRGRLQRRCVRNFTATPTGPDGQACPMRGGSCPQLVLAPSADVACNGGVRVLLGVQNQKMNTALGNKSRGTGRAGEKMEQRQWRQTARKICRTRSSIM